MLTVIIFILVLSVLVIIHELGHFLLAKKHGIAVHEFGLGYPPRLLTLFHWRGTKFSLNAIPFGGFVQMKGEDDHVEEMTVDFDRGNQDAFYQKSIGARMQVTLAGIAFNLIFAILAFAGIFSNLGIPQPLHDQVRISQVSPDSPAAAAGLQAQTNLLAFYSNEQWVEINSIQQAQEFVRAHLGETVRVRISAPCVELSCPLAFTEHELYLRQAADIPEGQGAMGVAFQEVLFIKYPWYQMLPYSIYYGFEQSLSLALLILQTLGQLLIDLLSGQQMVAPVAGPIGIVDQVQRYGLFDGGFWSILNFAALLSVNLAIMNLLPIPALDGGRAVLLIAEKFVRRKRIDKVARYLNYFGYVFLLSLMVLVSINDIRNIFIR